MPLAAERAPEAHAVAIRIVTAPSQAPLEALVADYLGTSAAFEAWHGVAAVALHPLPRGPWVPAYGTLGVLDGRVRVYLLVYPAPGWEQEVSKPLGGSLIDHRFQTLREPPGRFYFIF